MIYTLPMNATKVLDDIDGTIIEVNVTSRSNDEFKALSPFTLGPCHLKDGRVSKNMENAWQYSKVYPEHLTKYENVSKRWMLWSDEGLEKDRADRYPMGKGAVPKFSLYDNTRLDYVRAKHLIYYPLYAKAVVDQKECFKWLQELVSEYDHLIIRDFDAYNRRAFNMSLYDVATSATKRSGHGFVLEMMLTWGQDFYKIFR